MTFPLIEYQLFVLNKAAPYREVTQYDWDLLHAALGLSTEYLELVAYTSEENLKEELGDFLWYLMLAAHAIKYDVTQLPIVLSRDVTTIDMYIELEMFVSLVKKQCIYGKEKNAELTAAFTSLWFSFMANLNISVISLTDLIHANRMKLDIRYSDKFTAEESESRKDKTNAS